MPFTHGASCFSAERFDKFIHAEIPLPQVPIIEITEVEKKIAENVVNLIRDGSTIQIGLGSTPNTVNVSIKRVLTFYIDKYIVLQ
ncbi:MAG: hypothetical protein ABIA63_14560 [bacterium]